MPRRATCPQGHQWDLTEQETATVVSCPVCGQSTRITPLGPKTPSDTTAPDERTAPSSAPTITAWPTLTGYEILEELGQGGMGVVYKARQLSLQRIVAIKVMGGSTAASVERFKIEAEAVAHLQHSNIVQIYEVGEQEGRSFLALEYIDGGTLSKKLSQGPFDPHDAARLVETLARAIHHAHERGILHRDIKPGNILLTTEGVPKITDFGLAKRLEGPGVTQTGQGILGTPSYMAPEQAEGKSKKLGPAVDVYALGATLYEILTGRPPFREDTPLETMLKVTREEPVSPSHLRSDVPRDLETICLKCLQKSPALRYPTALALADDLRRFIEGESIHARPPTAWERAVRWVRRHREKVALSAGALAVLVLLVVMLWPRPAAKIDPTIATAPASALDLPPDLAVIPGDGPGFVTLNMAVILAREDLLELYKTVAKKLPILPSPAALGTVIEKEFGVRPGDMTRLTLLHAESPAKPQPVTLEDFPRGALSFILGEYSLVIVTTGRPYDRDKIQALYPGPVQLKKHRSKDYVVFPDSKAPTICFITPQILAVSKGEAKIKELLDRSVPADTRAPFAEALLLAKNHPYVEAFQPSAEQRKQRSDPDVPPKEGLGLMEGTGLFDVAAKVGALQDLNTATVTSDWDLRTTAGDVLQYNVNLTYADEASAKKGSQALELVRKEMANELKKAQQMLLEAEQKEIEILGSLRDFITVFLKEAGIAIRTARLQVQGRTVQLHVQLRMDIAELIGSLREATTKIQQAAVRTQLTNNLKEIGLALLAYHDVHRRLPPAVMYSTDGRPLYSWRVEILPFLGEKKLYDEFKRDETWDSPHNKKLLARMPAVFAPVAPEPSTDFLKFLEVPATVGSSWMALVPGQSRISGSLRALGWGSSLMPLATPFVRNEPHVTFVQAPVGPGCAFEGKDGLRITTFRDGTSNTILVIEAGDAVPWTKPADVTIDPKRPLPRFGGTADESIRVLLADGSVRSISRQTADRDLRALFTRNGGEKIDINKLP